LEERKYFHLNRVCNEFHNINNQSVLKLQYILDSHLWPEFQVIALIFTTCGRTCGGAAVLGLLVKYGWLGRHNEERRLQLKRPRKKKLSLIYKEKLICSLEYIWL